MRNSLLRTNKEITEIYNRHVKTVYRVCLVYMKTEADTEDMVQSTFINLIKYGGEFQSEEHEKAWLIRAAINLCKNSLKHWWRKRENIDDFESLSSEDGIEIDDIFQVVMSLPPRYKDAIYLYYYEGYKNAEIAEILNRPSSTIRNHLHEAREILKEKLGGVFDE